MCGIAGFSGTFIDAKAKLTLSNEHQLHRGPDASGLWFNSTGEIGLAH
jgi:asparagine synthetase B (glutamine-hydrolysing)